MIKILFTLLTAVSISSLASGEGATTVPQYECDAERFNCRDVKKIRTLVNTLKDNSRKDRFEAEYGLLNEHLVAIEEFYTPDKTYLAEHNFMFRSHFCALAYYFYDAEHNINREFEIASLRGTLVEGKRAMFRVISRYEWGLQPWSAEAVDESGRLAGHEFQCEGAGISRAIALGIEKLTEQVLASNEVKSKERAVFDQLLGESQKLVALREGDINVDVDASARKIIEIWDNNYDSAIRPFVKGLISRGEIETRARMVNLRRLILGMKRHKNYSIR